MTRTLRKLHRRFDLMLLAPIAWWGWRHRTDLQRALPLVAAAPKRLTDGELRDVMTEARVLFALATDPRTCGRRSIELCEVRDGVARLSLDPQYLDTASHHDVISVVGKVRGVAVIDIVPTTTTPEEMPFGEPVFA